MASTFFDRIDHLSDAVGHGDLVGSVKVDQIYAHYIHEGISHHTGRPLIMHEGGEAGYLRNPLYEKSDVRMKKLADATITIDGSHLESAMIEAMEALSEDVYERAPREFGDLRASGHPKVTSAGATIFDRLPHVHRLDESELRAKSRVRSLFRFERRR